jgi:hypothetical protein
MVSQPLPILKLSKILDLSIGIPLIRRVWTEFKTNYHPVKKNVLADTEFL